MPWKLKQVEVPEDEIHIVSSSKGRFIHTSEKDSKYWLTPWKRVDRITTGVFMLEIPNLQLRD